MVKYRNIDIFEDDGRFYLAKHSDHPLVKLDENFPYIETTEKTKRKHIEKLLDEEKFTKGLARLCNIPHSEFTSALEKEIDNTRIDSKCPYRRWIGPHVYKALGGYDHPFRATFGVWFIEAQILTFLIGIIPSIVVGDILPALRPALVLNLTLGHSGYSGAKEASKMKKDGKSLRII